MKTKLKLILLTLCCATQLHLASAQEAEIAQLLLNVEKLTQFKQILSDMKKGYDILSKGYGTVKDISEGNFKLHEVFLTGLMKVNPEIARYRKVADILRNQALILSEYRSAYNRFSSGGRFSQQELAYLSRVYGNLFRRSIDNLDELAMVVTASKLRMSDGERLETIDRIHEDMTEKLSFLRRFNRKTSTLDADRMQKTKEQKILEKVIIGK